VSKSACSSNPPRLELLQFSKAWKNVYELFQALEKSMPTFSNPWKKRLFVFQSLEDTTKVTVVEKPPYGGATNNTALRLRRL
jgi:hypothetical protein